MNEEKKSVFNYEDVELKDLSPEQSRLRADYFDTLKWQNASGELSELNSIDVFFDFRNHEDERLEFLKACSEVNLTNTYGNIHSVEQYLCHKFGMKTHFDKDWNPQIFEENKEFYSQINFIAQGIVSRERDIHNAILDGKTSFSERKAGTLSENYGISSVSDLENYVSKNLLNKDIEQENISEELNSFALKNTRESTKDSQVEVEVKNNSIEQPTLSVSFGEKLSINNKDFSARMFSYNDFNFVAVRKFSEEERTFVKSVFSNEQNKKLLSKNALYYAGFLENKKPTSEQNFEKALKVFNKTDFLKTSNSDSDIFYCREKGTFYTALNNDFLVPLEFVYSSDRQEKEVFENRFSDEIESFRNDNFNFLKGTSSYEFNEEKDFALMADISDVLSEGEVFTRRNVNIDGEIKIKLGDLFDKKNPEKIQPTGLRHLIKHRMEERMNKGLSMEDAQRETTAILFLALNNIDKAPAVKEQNGRYAIYKDGIKTLIGKDKKGKYVVSGFDYIDTKREATDSIGTGIARYGYTPGFLEIYDQVGAVASELNIYKKNSVVNEKQDNDFNNAVENRFNSASQKLASNLNSENYKEVLDLLNKMEELAGVPLKESANELQKSIETKINAEKDLKNMESETKAEVEKSTTDRHVSVEDKTNEKQVVQNMLNEEAAKEELTGAIIFGKTMLPSFLGIVDNQLKPMENYVIDSYDKESGKYVLKNGNTEFYLKEDALNSILNPKQIEQEIKQDSAQEIKTDSTPSIVFEDLERGIKGTVIPQFSINDINGKLTLYKDYAVKSFNKIDDTYTLTNGQNSITIASKEFKEITAPERWNMKFNKDSKIEDRMLKTQYDDFFKLRDNNAHNFIHNLSVLCRKSANNPIEALKLAKTTIERMPKEEQKKCKQMLNLVKGGMTMNEFIVDTYHSAIKSTPLNEDYLKNYSPKDVIARNFYDTVSTNGKAIENDPMLIRGENDFNLKIGDTINNIDIKNKKVFGVGKEKLHFSQLKVISASKEGNSITLLDQNKSFIKMPLDNLLSSYKEKMLNTVSRREREDRRNSMSISY